jgi:hypothetical protein
MSSFTLLKVGESSELAEDFRLLFKDLQTRFAHAASAASPFDAGRGCATLRGGELTVHLPKLTDRRGAVYQKLVTRADDNQDPA